METIDRKKLGAKSKAAGKAFEDKVYADLEKKGWIVSRWMKSVSDFPESNISLPSEEREDRKLIPARPAIRPTRRGPLLISTWTGFPDFIAFREVTSISGRTTGRVIDNFEETIYTLRGVECKMTGKLDREEKEKCEYLLESNTFSKILIASKGKKRGEIIYEEYETK